MQSKKFLASLAVMSVSVSLASCGGTENLGPDGRYGSADAAPAVLVRDLDVYRLIGNEEYVRIPLSDDLSESNAQKFFTATAENLHFDIQPIIGTAPSTTRLPHRSAAMRKAIWSPRMPMRSSPL